MGDIEAPKYLYHYTNINNLALILSKKILRLNCLTQVDDLSEAKTRGLKMAGKYVFVSCWTDKREENIPLWNMYTEKMKGVRIKLPTYPFKFHKIGKFKDGIINVDLEESIHRSECLFEKDYLPMILDLNNTLIKVEYTKDKDLLFPKTISKKNGKTYFNFSNVGKFKRSEWEFQSEWRYKVLICPFSYEDLKKYGLNYAPLMLESLRKEVTLSINDYYLDLDDNKMKDMEIILGPGTSEGDRLIVEALVKEYNQNAEVEESSLKGSIKCQYNF